MQLVAKLRQGYEEVRLYWKQPRPGEYVAYREIIMLSVGWMAAIMGTTFTIQFGVGNELTGMTLGLTNNELLIMSYVATAMSYIKTPINAYLIDNLRSTSGKYRVYMKLAVPSMILTLIALWLPYQDIGKMSKTTMIIVLFVVGQIQGYVQDWVNTGIWNIVKVLTPNTLERTRIMSITSILYSLGYTITGLYFPIMVDVVGGGDNKYTMRYYRMAYTPLLAFMPLVLVAYYGTKERLVLPKSRISNISFSNSLRAVTGNKIFWIKTMDGWNNFLEELKGNVWETMVYRARIMSSSTFGVLNTVSQNAQFWAMLLSPAAIRRFGKRNIKVWKNVMQIALFAGIGLLYKSKYAAVFLFIINTVNRFIDNGNVIDDAIDSDMRDNQQYLTGERIDGAFSVVSTFAGAIISPLTSLFKPWVYSKIGFDGSDYSVLNLYENYNDSLPNSQQTINPNNILYKFLDVTIWISVFGAAVDVIPWLFYDISETGQRSMIRVVRIRTLVEDKDSDERDEDNYLEGCKAMQLAQEYAGQEKKELLDKSVLKAARKIKDKEERAQQVKAFKEENRAIRNHNEEVEIAQFVNHELHRFEADFGKQQLALAQWIVSLGIDGFYLHAQEIIERTEALPVTDVQEERQWRKQDIRTNRGVKKSAKLVFARKKKQTDVRSFDMQALEDAYNMPDNTPQNARLRRAAMKKANKEKNRYALFAGPYLAAERTVELYQGYQNIDNLTADYDTIYTERQAKHDADHAETKRIEEERRLDIERRRAERKMNRKNK